MNDESIMLYTSLSCFLIVLKLVQDSTTIDEIKRKVSINIADIESQLVCRFKDQFHLTYSSLSAPSPPSS